MAKNPGPTSVFVITETPTDTALAVGSTTPIVVSTQLVVQRLPIAEGQDANQVVDDYTVGLPAGTKVYVAEDTKVDAYTVRAKVELESVEDPRLQAPRPETPSPHRVQ